MRGPGRCQTIMRSLFPAEPWRPVGRAGPTAGGARGGGAVGPRGRARSRPVPPLLAAFSARCDPAGSAARFERIFGSLYSAKRGRVSSFMELRLLRPAVVHGCLFPS